MDCTKLNQQIKQLEEEYQAFSEEMENGKLRWSIDKILKTTIKEEING